MANKRRADKKSFNRTKWKDMPPQARFGMALVGAIQLTLLFAAQRDISRRPAEQIRGSKTMWRLATLINFIGPASYFAFGRKKLPTVK